MIVRFLIVICLFLLFEWYSFQSIKTVFKSNQAQFFYIISSILLIVFFVWSFSKFDRSVGQTNQTLLTMGLFLLVFVPKFVLFFFMISEDLMRFVFSIFKWITQNFSHYTFPKRSELLSKTSLIIALIPFFMLLYGMLFGKHQFKVFENKISYKDLPEEFNGFKILHLSDIHMGSFKDSKVVEQAIKKINELDYDIVLFSGDIVNSLATEFDPWIDFFQKIKTPQYGKYSVLGNHDYGEYIDWKGDLAAKESNFEAIKNIHHQINFKLLLNEHVFIKKGNDSIVLVGVENWGQSFKKAGDLQLASNGLQNEFKILLSHDPSHWEYEIKDFPLTFHLTLSGHTHGMQFGLELGDLFKWSPVQYVYKHWAGLYHYKNKKLYVNRGFGFHAYPGRFGIWPEIGVIELVKE